MKTLTGTKHFIHFIQLFSFFEIQSERNRNETKKLEKSLTFNEMQCAEKQKVAARTGLPSHKYCNSILKANQMKLSVSLPFSAMKKAYTY